MKKTVLFTATILLVLTACQQLGSVEDATQSLEDEGVTWTCVEYACGEYGSGIEWAEANCEQTPNGTYCPVVQNGQQFAVPLQQINLTAISDSQAYCKEYRCVREAPTRMVNYTVNESALGPQRGQQAASPAQTQ